MIIDAKVSDSGEYRCEAENQYSRNSSSVDIRVQGKYCNFVSSIKNNKF